MIVEDPSEGMYLNFIDSEGNSFRSGEIKSNLQYWDWRHKVYDQYFRHEVGSDVAISREELDENMLPTTDPELVKFYKYKIELQKRIDGQSFADV